MGTAGQTIGRSVLIRLWTVICKDLAQVLDAFIPNVAQAAHPDIFTRLNTFRTQTLPSFDPTTKKDDESPEETSYVNTLIGLENFQVPLVPTVNSRAGLYIYVNAAVSFVGWGWSTKC